MSFPALVDLLAKVSIVPPETPAPGEAFELRLTPPPAALSLLAGDEPAAAFKLVLDRVDLSGLDVNEARRTLAVDIGKLVPTLQVDIGSLVPSLSAILGTLTPDLSTTVGTLRPSLEAAIGTLRPNLDAVLGALKPELRTVVGALAADLALSLDAAQSGSITGTVAQDEANPGSITGTVAQDEANPGSITGTIAQDDANPGSITGTVAQDDADPGTITGTIAQDEANPGSITGTIAQDPDNLGSITGSIEKEVLGHIKLPSLQQKVGEVLGEIEGSLVRSVLGGIEFEVKWRVEDEAGRPLRDQNDADPECVIEGPLNDPAAVPTVALLPEFVEYVRDATDLLTRRRIYCNLTVTVKVPGVGEPIVLPTQVGPLEVPIPRVPVPTVLVMTEHAATDPAFNDRNAGVLLAVPFDSQIDSITELTSALNDVLTVVGVVIHHAPTAIANRFRGLELALGRVKDLVGRRVRGIKADIVDDLWWHDIPERWPANFEDCLSALFMFGPPGRKVACHVKKNLWEAEGVFQVTLGPLAWAIAENFSDIETTPSELPGPKLLRHPGQDGGSVLDVVAGDPRTSPTGSFNDVLSSYQYLAPGESYVFRGR
jgi:hypothetical protein